MRTFIHAIFVLFIAALVLLSPIEYKRWLDKDCRNFHVVEEGVLYRSGQLPVSRLNQLVLNYKIRTIVSLRESKKDALDEQEEIWAGDKGLKYVRILRRTWNPDASGKAPGEISLQAFREVMDDPANHPVLVHCFAGIHRTGIMCAVYRMDFQGWTNDEAMTEMRTLGYTILDEHQDVRGFLTRYRPHRFAKTSLPLVIPVSRHIDEVRQIGDHP